MADPILLAHTAWALLDGAARPEIGDVVTIAIREVGLAFELDATVTTLEITEAGEVAILLDDIGCRWAMPIPMAAAAAA